jgi:hypothetical protein
MVINNDPWSRRTDRNNEYSKTLYALCSLYAHIQKLGVTSRQEETSQFVREKPPAKKPRVAKIRAG